MTVVVEVPVARLTTTVVVPEDDEHVGVPVNTAVIVCVPAEANEVGSVTVAGEAVVTGTVPSTVTPSKNTTEPPIGLPPTSVQVTVADTVVGAPAVTGVGEVTVTVLVTTLTVVVPAALEQPAFVLT